LVKNMKRKVLISADDILPDEPPVSCTALAVETLHDYECHRHGKGAGKAVRLTYALSDGMGTPYRPAEAFQCIDCFNECLRIGAKRARTRFAMWQDGWEICCDICRKADRDLRISQRRLFVKDKNEDSKSCGWDSQPTYLICEECDTREGMGLSSIYDIYTEEMFE
jgi:hypothetical protein